MVRTVHVVYQIGKHQIICISIVCNVAMCAYTYSYSMLHDKYIIFELL